MIVSSELSEHLGETRVVSTSADETHGEDRVERDGKVVIVTIFGESVEDPELGVGGTDETEGERNGLANRWGAIVHLHQIVRSTLPIC